ncbi:MAG TPA: DUF2853 family protein [Sphingomonas sp.]|nr:DUF2853 family protein [Sphingomonas sp.]
MAEDWAANVKKYVPDADDALIAGIVRYCGIALQRRDSSLVSFTDPAETGRVRENFLKKKLGLTQPDAELDTAIAGVGERMKGENFKNRVTVYYLLADHFGLLHLFDKSGKAGTATKASASTPETREGAVGAAGAAALGVAGAGAAGAASLFETGGGATSSAATPSTPAREPATPPAGDRTAAIGSPSLADDDDESRGSMRWLLWLLLALIVLALLWWLFHRADEATPAAPTTQTEVAAPAATTPLADGTVDLAAAPPEGSATIPTGAGVTTEMRDGKPVVKVYFDTGKTDVVDTFGATAGGLKTWLASHAGSSLGVSGFNDKTGDAAANAVLSKQRAEAVKAALVTAGIADSSIELVKPTDTTDTTTNDAGARRVEVFVR